jgi:release factor glutamine methyltransferase
VNYFEYKAAVLDVRGALREAMARLGEAGVASHALAAELLLMKVLGCERAWLYSRPEQMLEPARAEQYFTLVSQRIAGTPTQYLTGRQEFWGLEFEVTPDVLIPRPETEHVVEVVLERLSSRRRPQGLRPAPPWAGDRPAPSGAELRIADVGTGSGCLAVAIASELPEAVVFATDISPAALAVARRNAARHAVADRIQFFACDLLGALECGSWLTPSETGGARGLRSGQGPPHSEEKFGASVHESRLTSHESRAFHLIVSNPPYVGRHEAESLPREVGRHEPGEALFGGEQGFEVYPPLVRQAERLLVPGGILVLELSYNALEPVRSLLGSPAWTNVGVTNDLAGIPRVIAAEKL